MRIRKFLAMVMALVIGISIIPCDVRAAENEGLSDELINEVIQNGEWISNEDGSYSFVLVKEEESVESKKQCERDFSN